VESITTFDHVEPSKLVPTRPFPSDSSEAMADGYTVTTGKHCGGTYLNRWADGGSSLRGHGKYSQLAECKSICDAHDDCTGFVHRDSDNRCSFWITGALLLRDQGGYNCYAKAGDPVAASLFKGDFTSTFAAEDSRPLLRWGGPWA
jgi:hypothetical protein